MTDSTDRIEKHIVLKAPRERVWQAISDARQFGTWFGVDIAGPFVAGQPVTGRLVPTRVDEVLARKQAAYEGMTFQFFVERIEPPHRFSFRWHPCAVEPGADYSQEPTTLIVFTLEEVADGTLLTITESGFDQVPLARRAAAFAANEEGWREQLRLIETYLALAA